MRLSRSLYRLALLAYPPLLRRELGTEMLRTFEDRLERDERVGATEVARELSNVVATGLGARLKQPRSAPSKLGPGTRFELLLKDARQAGRTLARSPGFTVVSSLSLALGIGANTAIFSFVNAALWKPLPVHDPEELVAVYATREPESFPNNLSYPNYRDLSESEIFSSLVGFQGTSLSVEVEGGSPEIAWGEIVTENYFSGLGVSTVLGRGFLPADAYQPVAVLSYDYWRRRFDSDESILGRPLRINGREFEVTGVAAKGFTGAKFLGFTPDMWLPVTMHEVVWPGSEDRLERRGSAWVNVRGRLAPGVGVDEAKSALAAVASRLESEFPEENRNLRLHLLPAPRKIEPVVEVQMGDMLPLSSMVLLAIVGIVLLIACANVASLKLARSLARDKELALRLSLGATRSRLVRQIAFESVLLALAAGALGVWMGTMLLHAALGLNPILDFAIDYGVEMDWRVIVFTAAITLLAALFSGLLPALRVARRDVTATLREGGGYGASPRTAWRRFLVIPQLALSLVALVAAGLLIRSFQNASAVSPGFATEGIVLASFNLDLLGYDESSGKAFHRQLLERLRQHPEVEAVSLAFPLPLDAYTEGDRIYPEGSDDIDGEKGTLVLESAVGESYFETMEAPLLHGRPFRRQDDESVPRVAIVNETLARRFWPEENAVGKRFRSVGSDEPVEVVGVARDGKYLSIGEEPRPYFFVPLAQAYRAPVTLVVRMSPQPERSASEASREARAVGVGPYGTNRSRPQLFEATLRKEVRGLDPRLPVYGVKTIEEYLARPLAGARALALSVSFFAVLASMLATVGLYGLMSFSVSRKRHELGIRMALGASKRDVVTLFLLQAARVVGIGIASGLVLAWSATRILGSLLIGVEATNPLVFAVVAAFLALVALAGSYFPSLRAARVDPLTTLRHD